MISMPVISICIPTYNRSKYLKELLGSIANNDSRASIEVVISDNASIDSTADVVNSYLSVFKNIKYFRWESNQGADRNYLKSVEMATGKYCWLMGSDDLLPENAIDDVLSILSDADIYLVDRLEVDINLRGGNSCKWLSNINDCDYDFAKQSEIERYFNSCKRLGGLFSYLSSIIVKRESWNKYRCPELYIGTLYSHAYILLAIVMNGGRLQYIPQDLVISRSGNDSFLTKNWIQRTLIDLEGYRMLGNDLIAQEMLRDSFWNVMKHELKPVAIFKTLASSGFEGWSRYKSLACMTYKISPVVLFAAELTYIFLMPIYKAKKYIVAQRSKWAMK